ncbi:hypothetical protein FKP32DRAFT_1671144 [Trametes sanguinea]|nr:hypothetical protein FKP32DRAFT_1671144 [Trametes sanguinea]
MIMNAGDFITFSNRQPFYFLRDSAYWSPMGGGVLVARNHNVAFRIPLPVVVRHSSVLQAMFATSACCYMDENGLLCQAILLDEDPKAIRCLLQFLVNGHYEFSGDCHKPEEVYWRVLMGTKYGVQALVDAMYPVVLRFLHHEHEEFASIADFLELPFDDPSVPIALLHTALLLQGQHPHLLPSALVYCGLLSPRDILRPVKLSTGTTLAIPQPWAERCLAMQTSLLQVTLRIVMETFKSEASQDCTNPAGPRQCAAIRGALCSQALQKLTSPSLPMMQPFRVWTQLMTSGECGLCRECMFDVHFCEGNVLAEEWEMLPCILDLEASPGWPTDGVAENPCRRHCVQPSVQETCDLMSDHHSYERNWSLHVDMHANEVDIKEESA